MNEAAARQVTLLEAFERAQPASPSWGDDDRAWADRVALEVVGAQAPADEFVAQRAGHAMQRLASRERGVARWLAQPMWHRHWGVVVASVAFLVGLLADGVGGSQRVNLLAPPLWGVLAWNALVYLGLLSALLARLLRRGPGTPGPVLRGTQALLRLGRGTSGMSGRDAIGALNRFAQLWAQRCARLSALRAEAVLHVAAALLAVGLIAGLYARGLVFDYRAAWESTFLSPASAHALVSGVLGPASRLSGVALPDVAGFAALQATHGDATAGVPAAPWLHLLGVSLLLFVVLPRALLALVCALRGRLQARRFALPLDEPYFQRLLRLQRGAQAQVQVWPYAFVPSPQAVLGLRALLADAFGARVGLQVAPGVAFGGEDDALPAPVPTTSHAFAWFDLSATPEAENHARFVRRLAAAAPPGASVLVLIDEASFTRRFAALPERVAQRREVWRAMCEGLGTLPVFADFEAMEPAAAVAPLQAALARPVRTSEPGERLAAAPA
jgi:Protein of unknown function (DUF2868)